MTQCPLAAGWRMKENKSKRQRISKGNSAMIPGRDNVSFN